MGSFLFCFSGDVSNSWTLNDIGRNSLLGNRKKMAKFVMGTFICRSTLIKKKIKFSSYESYMRRGFLMYEEMPKYFPIYEEAVSHIWLCNCSTLNFIIYEENLIFFFISVPCSMTKNALILFLGLCAPFRVTRHPDVGRQLVPKNALTCL